MLDTGSSYIIMPEKDFITFKETITKYSNRTCGTDPFNHNFFYCQCLRESYNNFPDLTISLGSGFADSDKNGSNMDNVVRKYTIPS